MATLPHCPGPYGIQNACEAIEAGDMNLARAELGFTYTLVPWQVEHITAALQYAAIKFGVPELATRDPLTL